MIFFLMLCFFQNNTEHQVFKDNVQLEMKQLATYDDIGCNINRLRWLPDYGVVIFSFSEKKIKLYNTKTHSIQDLARRGGGPNEIKEYMASAFVFDDKIVYRDQSLKLKAFRPGEKHVVINETLWAAVSECVKVGDVAVCINVGFSPVSTDVPNNSLLIFEINDDGTWKGVGGILDEDITGQFQEDIKFAANVELFAGKDEDLLYRFPHFLYPDIQLMDLNGKIHRKIPIPHPAATKLPKDAKKRNEYRLKYSGRPRPITDMVADANGNLYSIVSNVPGKKDLSGRIIAKQDHTGKIVRSFRIDVPVLRIVVSPDGKRIIVADEDDTLYELVPQ